jgi:hypothetical protein
MPLSKAIIFYRWKMINTFPSRTCITLESCETYIHILSKQKKGKEVHFLGRLSVTLLVCRVVGWANLIGWRTSRKRMNEWEEKKNKQQHRRRAWCLFMTDFRYTHLISFKWINYHFFLLSLLTVCFVVLFNFIYTKGSWRKEIFSHFNLECRKNIFTHSYSLFIYEIIIFLSSNTPHITHFFPPTSELLCEAVKWHFILNVTSIHATNRREVGNYFKLAHFLYEWGCNMSEHKM